MYQPFPESAFQSFVEDQDHRSGSALVGDAFLVEQG